MTGFPTWHDSSGSGDNTWSLSPSKIVYYKNCQKWEDTIAEILMISDSAGLNITQEKAEPVQTEDRIAFPYDIFPVKIQII
jgi:hypothetical protein